MPAPRGSESGSSAWLPLPCCLPQVCGLVVTVLAWQLTGEPAPGIEFSWQCMVEGGRSRFVSLDAPDE